MERDRSWCGSADGCSRLLCKMTIGDLQGLLGLRDLGHGGLGDKATALQLPFLLLLQQLAAHQAGDRGVVGEDADDVGASFDLLIEPVQRVGVPHLAPVLLREVQERQQVVSGGLHHIHSARELLAQHLADRYQAGRAIGLFQSLSKRPVLACA